MRKLFLLFLLLKGINSFPQISSVQDTAINNQFEQVILFNQQNQGISSPLYNGVVHTGYSKTIAGIPYYLSSRLGCRQRLF